MTRIYALVARGLVSFAFVLSLAQAPIASAACSVDTTPTAWAAAALGNNQAQSEYLTSLKACLRSDVEKQKDIDQIAVRSISVLARMPAENQQQWANFIAQALAANAEAGYASSQHNYAAIFDAPPNSLLGRLFEQNQMKFAFWTRKAAAQGEPRALFNLAVRMAIGVPAAGIAKDEDTAFKLLVRLQSIVADIQEEGRIRPLLGQMSSAIIQTEDRLTHDLGPERVRTLTAEAATFNLATLAP